MSAVGRDAAQAVLTIELDALKANWRLLADRVAPTACGAVVKADAYGLGIEQAVPALARAGCRTFFVAHLGEGMRARTALRGARFWPDTDIDIFLLHGLQPGAKVATECFAHRLGPVLGSRAEIEAWADEVTSRQATPLSAVQLDTGMNRIGISPDVARSLSPDLLSACNAAFVMSHFVSAEDADDPLNQDQIVLFDQIRANLCPTWPASLANSSGIFLPQRPYLNLVRPGYALYGGNPCPGGPNPMRPVIRLEAAILQTREIGPGETVGYNGRWVAQRPTRLATIGVGYADGIPRGAHTTGADDGPIALVAGVACPWVGRVSMDLSILDVTDAPAGAARPGAPAELIGPAMPIDEFGHRCGTIGYEILTSLGARYSRVYVENT